LRIKPLFTIDCQWLGFGVTAEIKFSKLSRTSQRNFITLPSPIRNFKTVVSRNWNDILVEISMPKIQLASKKEAFVLN
jgi:hypothetical protein